MVFGDIAKRDTKRSNGESHMWTSEKASRFNHIIMGTRNAVCGGSINLLYQPFFSFLSVFFVYFKTYVYVIKINLSRSINKAKARHTCAPSTGRSMDEKKIGKTIICIGLLVFTVRFFFFFFLLNFAVSFMLIFFPPLCSINFFLDFQIKSRRKKIRIIYHLINLHEMTEIFTVHTIKMSQTESLFYWVPQCSEKLHGIESKRKERMNLLTRHCC